MRALAVLLALAAAPAAAECRQALALGLDVSGSVDREEYDLQLTGLAQALLSPAVQEAFLAFPDAPVDLYVFEWSGLAFQLPVVPWTTVAGADDLRAIAEVLTAPGHRPRSAETAVGMGLIHGAEALAERPECWRRTLDISSDGTSNIGPRPRDVRAQGVLAGVTVNALVVGISPPREGRRSDSVAELSAYFRAEVIQGAEAFVQVAVGYQDYRTAMEKKLLRELETLPVGRSSPPGWGPGRQAASGAGASAEGGAAGVLSGAARAPLEFVRLEGRGPEAWRAR
jgi:hypothetical protein